MTRTTLRLMRFAFAGVLLVALSLIPAAQSTDYAFAVTLYNPITNDSAIGYLTTDGFDADVTSRFVYTEADGLTAHGSPSFSPDGSQLMYVATPLSSRAQIFVQTITNGRSLPLNTDATVTHHDAIWSPDGTKIAFSAAAQGSVEDIFIMNADGSGVTQITDTQELSEIGVSWSPDGLSLAYVQRDADLAYQVMIVSVDGGDAAPLGNPAVVGTTPKWSADGTRILYATRDIEERVTTVSSAALDGTDIQVHYTYSGEGEIAPGIDSIDLSPDGSVLAFIQAEFTADGDIESTLHLLNIESGEATSPVWITDGLWVGSLDFAPAAAN